MNIWDKFKEAQKDKNTRRNKKIREKVARRRAKARKYWANSWTGGTLSTTSPSASGRNEKVRKEGY